MQTERGLDTVGKIELREDERKTLLDAYENCTGNCEKCPCVALISGTSVSLCGVLGEHHNRILKAINMLMEKF